MGITEDAIDKAEQIVLADLKSKKLGNNTPAPDDPKGPISQAVKEASLQLDPRSGTVKGI